MPFPISFSQISELIVVWYQTSRPRIDRERERDEQTAYLTDKYCIVLSHS